MERKSLLQFSCFKTAALPLVATAAIVAGMAGCSGTAAQQSEGGNQASTEASQTTQSQESQTQAQENTETKAVYEAVSLDNAQISDLFAQARGSNAALAKVPSDYHITTAFQPETAHPEWYGQTVNVHVTTYAMQEVKMEDGTLTENEGFKVELTSENEQLNSYLASLNKNFHITGSSKDAPRWTENIDFSQGQPFEANATGTFGAYMTDQTVKLQS